MYSQLEVELVGLRQKTKEKVVNFKEATVETKLKGLSREMEMIDVKLRDSHEVNSIHNVDTTIVGV